MRIEHIALWTNDLEGMKDFYSRYFGGKAGNKYVNSKTCFESYFIGFNGGARLEIMKAPSVIPNPGKMADQYMGYAHMALSVGSKESVDALVEKLRQDGYKVISEPRTTGDGYYESCVLDPDGNRVEITV